MTGHDGRVMPPALVGKKARLTEYELHPVLIYADMR